MAFLSYEFPVFMIVLLFLYYFLPKRMQWTILLAGSLLFYSFSGAKYLLFLLTTTFSIYGTALWLDRVQEKRTRFRIIWIGAGLNLGIFVIVKYTNFIIGNCNHLMAMAGAEKQLERVNWLLPLGISYYTLQALGYLIDVYHKKYEAERNPFRLLLFLSFFPQVVQGPVSRFDQLKKSLFAQHQWSWDRVYQGLWRILWGAYKKLVVADRVAPVVAAVGQNYQELDGIYVLIGMFAYTLQLYGDFTGGIDIALGCAQMFGITLPENFDRPFASVSLAEYWRRWHMSLMQWFREYVFYPLSGSRAARKLMKTGGRFWGRKRAAKLPVYYASLITWFLTGIWHGASWNFVIWGMVNCLILLVSQEASPLYRRFHKKYSLSQTKAYHGFMTLRTLFLVSTVQIFEYYPSPGIAVRMFLGMFGSLHITNLLDGRMELLGISNADIWILGWSVLLFCLVGRTQSGKGIRAWFVNRSGSFRFAVWFSMFLVVLVFGIYGQGYDARQFIYNQF